MVRKVSHKVLDYQLLARLKTPTFFTITLAAIIFIVCADSIIFNPSLQPSNLDDTKVFHTDERLLIESTITDVPSRSIKEEIKVDDREYHNSLIPPFNVTEEERINWFRKKLPEFEIFESNNLTQEFHGRVLGFFNNECSVRFFMTWISPASSFGSRDFLAMESLFKVNPQACLMILSKTMDSTQGYKILKPLLDHEFKVAAVAPDLSFLFKNTPAEAWFDEMKRGNKDPGEIPLTQNLSNLIRLAILYKYGGVYLDTDFIVLKSFRGLSNAIGAQSIDPVSKSWTRLNNAVLVFDRNHPLLFNFMKEFASTFDGNKWGHNGPYLVSRVVQRVAGRPGYNFTILSPMAFYPVDWTKIDGYFKKPENQVGSRWVKAKLLQLSGETYGIHLWNKQSSGFSIEEGSVISRLTSDHCVICEHIHNS